MGHSVKLVVGRGKAIAAFLEDWPGARAVALKDDWRAVPVDEALHEAIAARFHDSAAPEELDFAPRGITDALARATAGGGGLAYVETEYFGGTGGQSAVAYVDGRQASGPERSKGASGPINAALRAVGAGRDAGDDEFDTIGLGYRRSMDDYGPAGPVRLGGKDTAAGEPAQHPHIPLWLVLLVFAACLALGVAIAMSR